MQTALFVHALFLFRTMAQKSRYNGKKKNEKLFQNLQNRMIRKILGTFKTTACSGDGN